MAGAYFLMATKTSEVRSPGWRIGTGKNNNKIIE